MDFYKLAEHPTAQLMARFSGEWPRILKPGSIFTGYCAVPTCLYLPEERLAFLPVIGNGGTLVGLIQFATAPIIMPIRKIAVGLRADKIIEVQSSLLFLYSRPALLVDAAPMLRAASAIQEFFTTMKGDKIDIRMLIETPN